MAFRLRQLVRMVGGPGVDPYYKDVSLANIRLGLNFDGPDAPTTFTEVTGKVMTAYGNAHIGAVPGALGGAELVLDGAGDYLTAPLTNDLNFSAPGIEMAMSCFVTPTDYISPDMTSTREGSIAAHDYAYGTRCWMLFMSGNSSEISGLNFLVFHGGSYTQVSVPAAYNLGQRYFIEVSIKANRIYVFVNGQLKNLGGTAFTGTINFDATHPVKIGALMYDTGYDRNFPGRIDDFLIRVGAGEAHTADYTPPTAAFNF